MEELVNEPVKSKKDLFLERHKQKYPEFNYEDEDAFYGSLNEDYDEYEGKIEASRKNETDLANLFSSDPRSAAFLMGWKNGENPVVQLMRTYGDDFKEALEDPELQEQFAEARSEYLEKQTRNAELQEQAKRNLTEMLDNLDAAQSAGGYTDEQADKAFEMMAQILDDGIINKVSRETWEMVFKAINHDLDVETAAHEGEVRGRNAKINREKKKRTVPAEIPPNLGGQREVVKPTRKSLGALDRYGDNDEDIFSRGGIKRK